MGLQQKLNLPSPKLSRTLIVWILSIELAHGWLDHQHWACVIQNNLGSSPILPTITFY